MLFCVVHLFSRRCFNILIPPTDDATARDRFRKVRLAQSDVTFTVLLLLIFKYVVFDSNYIFSVQYLLVVVVLVVYFHCVVMGATVGKGKQFRQSKQNNPAWSIPVLDETRLVAFIETSLRAKQAALVSSSRPTHGPAAGAVHRHPPGVDSAQHVNVKPLSPRTSRTEAIEAVPVARGRRPATVLASTVRPATHLGRSVSPTHVTSPRQPVQQHT